MRDFRKLDIWEKGISLVKEVYVCSGNLPSEEKFGLKSQLCRAAISIPSNIAEGASRSGDKEFCRFLEIAMGSAFELETQLIIIEELGMLDKSEINHILGQANILQKQINKLITTIKTSNSQMPKAKS